jgi:hypothetical protein
MGGKYKTVIGRPPGLILDRKEKKKKQNATYQ